MKTESTLSPAKHTPESVEFSDVQIVYKFGGKGPFNLDFKVTILFNLKYVENGTDKIELYLQRQTDKKSPICSIEWCLFQWHRM